MSADLRDKIGLVQAIAVKEHSSSKQKTLFKRIQLCHQADPDDIAKQMLINMKVRWSSTYAMLDRAHNLKESVNDFAFEITMDVLGEKHRKLAKLQLSEAEWIRVDLFLNLLAVAEQTQHRFSSDLKSMLQLALPALESLHTSWTQLAADPRYTHFVLAIEEALEKVDEYYQKTSNSDAYTFAMVKPSKPTQPNSNSAKRASRFGKVVN
ncbi:hypothetical protein B0H14DRAFT_2601876 [Mycena olivaceomarginata]|nr:hypothetical protein B0H14DRAFT_2601876 [Mycena olivaceomarginata]